MAAVGVHGWLKGDLAIGLVGAVVSLIAKCMWIVVLKHATPEMDSPTRQWLAKQRAKLDAEAALAVGMRQPRQGVRAGPARRPRREQGPRCPRRRDRPRGQARGGVHHTQDSRPIGRRAGPR